MAQLLAVPVDDCELRPRDPEPSRLDPGARARHPAPPADIAIIHGHCAVYTKPEVARAILDMAGWTADRIEDGHRLLEPAAGDGVFLVAALERLLAWRERVGADPLLMAGMLRGYEFEHAAARATRENLVRVLVAGGQGENLAFELANGWIRCEDFLLGGEDGTFTHVVGNPPYMRWSLVPAELRAAYEAALPRDAARGDLCLAFVARAVDVLRSPGSRLAFLCSDRWLRCAYGEDFRNRLAGTCAITAHVDVHAAPVFSNRERVGIHPAVTVVERSGGLPARGSVTAARTLEELQAVASSLAPGRGEGTEGVLGGGGGARLSGSRVREVLDVLASAGVGLADAGVRVRCGYALGYAAAFVVDRDGDGIEPGRLLPWVRSRDLATDGRVTASRAVLNVWDDDGRLVSLAAHPGLAAHLGARRDRLLARACVSGERDWYRTIDRIDLQHLSRPRVAIAGMARRARVGVIGPGMAPANSMYMLCSDAWPVEQLASLLRAGLLDVYGEVLSPRFPGGTRRFDGNVLRQLRLPIWSALTSRQRGALEERDLASGHDVELLSEVFGIRARAKRDALRDALDRIASEAGGGGAA